MTTLIVICGIILAYLFFTLFVTYLVHQIPRKPIDDLPDWGRITDTWVPTINGGQLETWYIEPDGTSKGVVVLAHGWSRNRGRMVKRAKIFGKWGYTTVIHSARDHGLSSPKQFMNASRMAEDIEAVIEWVGKPVILYGHSAGAAGAAIFASRKPEMVELLFLEGCYADTHEMLKRLLRRLGPVFYYCFSPMVLIWMNLFYGGRLDSVSPARLATHLKMPVMLIHGENDDHFPLDFALKLKSKLPHASSDIYIAPGASHSDSSLTPGYPEAIHQFLIRHLSSSQSPHPRKPGSVY